MPQPLLSGEVGFTEPQLEPERIGPSELELLRAEVAELREEVLDIKTLLLRQYSAYRQSFGEQNALTPDSADKWSVIKQRLAPRLREAIEILQLQGSMKRTQLAVAMKMDYSNCAKNVVGMLLRQGLLVDNGGNLSLKPL